MADPQSAVGLSRRTTHIDQLTVGQGVLVEALVPERTLARTLLKVLAVRRVAGLLVVVDQLILLLAALHPHDTGTHKVRRDATRGAASESVTNLHIV